MRKLEPMRALLEVCVDSAEGLRDAVESGAGRIELCSALALSGLTPSAGLIAIATTYAPPVYVMIRPRGGDFIYGPDDLDMMRRDIDAVRRAGLPGVVLGVSRPNGELDGDKLHQLMREASGLGVTLHRAFDIVPDPSAALEMAIALGFERILTSGGAASAPEGADCIADLVAQASDRIIIMAGSGVTADNVTDLIDRTGVKEVHASCGAPGVGPGARPADDSDLNARMDLILGPGAVGGKRTSAAKIREMKTTLDRYSEARSGQSDSLLVSSKGS